MKRIKLGNITTSNIAMGCMRIADKTVGEVERLVNIAIESGVDLFDHADIYGGGKSEEVFGNVLKLNPALRKKMYIQSKCGIRSGFYDFSYEHITSSVDSILDRLGIEYLDTLIFHRPDALAEKEEFARAIEDLRKSGKVRQFGVSNMNPAQIELLEAWSGEKMVLDQLQFSLMHAGLVSSGINVNVENREGTMFDGAFLPYAERREIALQAWSPFQYGMFEGCFIGNPRFPELNRKLDELAGKYNVTPSAIAVAWILRIPGAMQVVLGTSNPEHLGEALKGADVTLTRKEWYELYLSAGYLLP